MWGRETTRNLFADTVASVFSQLFNKGDPVASFCIKQTSYGTSSYEVPINFRLCPSCKKCDKRNNLSRTLLPSQQTVTKWEEVFKGSVNSKLKLSVLNLWVKKGILWQKKIIVKDLASRSADYEKVRKSLPSSKVYSSAANFFGLHLEDL